MGFTGADFYALSSDAMLLAMKRKVETTDACVLRENAVLCNGDVKSDSKNSQSRRPATVRSVLAAMSPEELKPEVTREDFMVALKSLSPSLSAKDIARYDKLKDTFSIQQRSE